MPATPIDIESWNRGDHFKFFMGSAGSTRLSLTQPLDVTELAFFCKKNTISFYYSLIFLVTQTANEIAGFRHRVVDGQPFEFDILHPLFTDLNKDDDLFRLVMAEMETHLIDFVKKAKQLSKDQSEYLPVNTFMDRYDILNITCYPWGDFSSMQVKPVQQENCDPGIPFIAWGKYQQQANRLMTSLHTEVNHCFLDAIHLYQFKTHLEDKIKLLK
ncbi:CatA-like O-acetyltransferase [Microbulbifer sp. DLAB2-AA]|uniref:CatA-like O-acetyltransferase n=1 Tax=Microbulbifer sp. DLAB2-AA TaxID=3243394 RepID=UPI004039E503